VSVKLCTQAPVVPELVVVELPLVLELLLELVLLPLVVVPAPVVVLAPPVVEPLVLAEVLVPVMPLLQAAQNAAAKTMLDVLNFGLIDRVH
jgi:hypothetical protein